MATFLGMPRLGVNMVKGKIVSWLVQEGESVAAGQPLVEIETDKVVQKVESPVSGILARILTREDEEVPCTAVMAVILAPGEPMPAAIPAQVAGGVRPDGEVGASLDQESSPPRTQAPIQPERINASPSARALAAELGVDLTKIAHAGARITRDDVEAAYQSLHGLAPGTGQHAVQDSVLVADYRLMCKIRKHEEAVIKLYREGKIGGTTHLCIGQEAVAAGVIGQLRRDDYISSTHRGHGHMLAKGGELKPMLAEILGKATGYCKGKGGSIHIASAEVGNLGANGIVSGGLPIAVGAGLSIKMRKTDQIAVACFGDGAANEGNTHESMNLASLWHLPVLFLYENNHYAVSTEYSRSTAGSVGKRAAGYEIPSARADGNDIEAVHVAAREAIQYVRQGKGPYLLECETYRIEGHYYGDPMVYRDKAEVEEWRKRDPIVRAEGLLLERGILDNAQCQQIRDEVQREVDEAVEYALNSPEPAPESLYTDLYTGDIA